MQELRQNEFRQHAELIRLQTTRLVNMSGRSLKDGETLNPTDLWKYDWDENTNNTNSNELHELTDEEIKAHNAQLAAMLD